MGLEESLRIVFLALETVRAVKRSIATSSSGMGSEGDRKERCGYRMGTDSVVLRVRCSTS